MNATGEALGSTRPRAGTRSLRRIIDASGAREGGVSDNLFRAALSLSARLSLSLSLSLSFSFSFSLGARFGPPNAIFLFRIRRRTGNTARRVSLVDKTVSRWILQEPYGSLFRRLVKKRIHRRIELHRRDRPRAALVNFAFDGRAHARTYERNITTWMLAALQPSCGITSTAAAERLRHRLALVKDSPIIVREYTLSLLKLRTTRRCLEKRA